MKSKKYSPIPIVPDFMIYTPILDASTKYKHLAWLNPHDFSTNLQNSHGIPRMSHVHPLKSPFSSDFPRPGEGREGLSLGRRRDSGALRQLSSGAGGEDSAPWLFGNVARKRWELDEGSVVYTYTCMIIHADYIYIHMT